MIKKILIAFVAAVVLLSVAAFSYVQKNKSPQIFQASKASLHLDLTRPADPESLRTIDTGQIVGFSDYYDTHAWLNIPYAAAPVGELRWRAPQPAIAWQGVRKDLEYGAVCTQFWGILAGVDGQDGELVGDEDCLSLNVWAPKRNTVNSASSSRRPVMVWIHGGGNNSGTANTYQAHHLAGSKDVVVVTLNYRLGLLGWFSHDALRDTADNPLDASGNFGTLDLIAGLRWVQRNIDEFGGDPNNVTIFGESAGGKNVFSLLASPLAKGLFHKAISQSGSADTTPRVLAEEYPDERSSKAYFGLENSSKSLFKLYLSSQNPGLDEAALRSKLASADSADLLAMLKRAPATQLLQMASDNIGQLGYTKTARIIQDGHVIPQATVLSLLDDPQKYNSVPLMLGSNRDEQKVFLARDPDYVDQLFGVLPRVKNRTRYDRVSQYVSDNWKAGAVDEPAKRISRSSSHPVFAYRFDWDDAPTNVLIDLQHLLGASHGFEISFVFGDFEGGVPLDIVETKANAEGRRSLSLAMMDYWAAFAHHGDPAKGLSGQQVQWSAWQAQGNNLLLLDSPSDAAQGGGIRMAEVRTNVADIKAKIPNDAILVSPKDRCQAYAGLFLHGYQASDFWDPAEYAALGCEDHPVGQFRDS